MKKIISIILVLTVFAALPVPGALAAGGKEAAASLLLPTTGQAMNGEVGTTKTKVMAGVEVASVATIAILGVATGGGIVWAGLGPLLANHLWSSADAYKTAKNREQPLYSEAPMMDAQRTLELSRERRYAREGEYRSDLRERLMRVREQAENS